MKKTIKYILIIVALSTLSAYLSYKLLSIGLTVEVPDVRGMGVSDAKDALMPSGLDLKIESESFSMDAPIGAVITQDLAPGSRVRGAGSLNVVLSKGPEIKLIPSFVGETIDNSMKILTANKLVLNDPIYVHADTIEKGTIIAQSPAPEEWAGEAITLVVSAGRHPVIYYMPAFKGMLKDDALRLCADLELNAEIMGLNFSDTVVDQRPAAGEEIEMGDTVYLKLFGVKQYD